MASKKNYKRYDDRRDKNLQVRQKEIKSTKSIKELIDKRMYNKAYSELMNYMETHPNDNKAKVLYGMILLRIGLEDEAEEVLKNQSKKDPFALNQLIILYIDQKRYEEAYSAALILEQNKERNAEGHAKYGRKAKLYKLFLEGEMGLDFTESIDMCYMASQIIDYSEEKAIKHIMLHFDESQENKTIFNQELDAREVFEQAKKRISEIELEPQFLEITDEYYFHATNIGHVDWESRSYLKVIAIKGTKNIVGIYPVTSEDACDIHEFEVKEIEELKKPKTIRQLSQTEKFMQRLQKSNKQST